MHVLCRSATGACISVYGVTDKATVKKIVDLFVDNQAENPKIHYELYIYPRMKREAPKQKAALELVLKKKKGE